MPPPFFRSFPPRRDDHEIGDDAWRGGAGDFKGSRPEWERRSQSALTAFGEWVPVRGLDPAAPDPTAGTRALHFGDLCTLIVSEGRLSGRDATMDVDKTDFYKETAMKPQKEWDDAKIREARLDYLKRCADPERHLLGPRQEAFIEAAVRESAAAGRPWVLFGSQTVMAPLIAPRLLETLPLQPAILRSVCRGALAVGTSDKLAGPEIARQARQYLAMGKYRVPMNPAS